MSKYINKDEKINWNDFEIENDENGRPFVNLLNENLPKFLNIDVSVSHCKEYATATTTIFVNDNTRKD